jgi:hypothetical protein
MSVQDVIRHVDGAKAKSGRTFRANRHLAFAERSLGIRAAGASRRRN